MKLFKDALKNFIKSKIFLLATLITYAVSISYEMLCYGMKLDVGTIQYPLNRVLNLSFYLFLVAIFLSYEYFRQYQHNGMDEVLLLTSNGCRKKHYIAAFFVMTLWSMIVTAFLMACVIVCFRYYHIHDPNGEYMTHIVKNMLINFLLILELGNLIGFLLSKIENRIISYAWMLLIIFLTSPYLERIADVQSRSNLGKGVIYPITELFNIMPLVHNGFQTIFAFGESILFYRVSKILFWIFFVLVLIFITRKWNKKSICFLGIFMLAFFFGFFMPASTVNMDGNPENTMAHDQYYYLGKGGEVQKIKTEKADFFINQYKMKLNIDRLLRANVMMEVSQSLDEYKFTLYHGYHVKKVWTQDGKELSFKQKNDYITVKNNGNQIKNICMKYSGYAPAYYSNTQGIYLPGNFAYYPRAGYVPLFDQEKFRMASCFVDTNTLFRVTLNYHGGRVYTNLEKNNGVYTGKCDGFTIMSGFYKEKDLGNGNRLIYNYLYDEYYYTKKEFGNDAETFDESCKEIQKTFRTNHIKDMVIFVIPNVNQTYQIDIGEHQILTKTILLLTD